MEDIRTELFANGIIHYIVKSKNIWINPENTIIERNIKQFPVYINRNDIKKYFVDIDILENKEG